MPFGRAARSTRSGRPGAPNDADVFDGLPVRKWRLHEALVGAAKDESAKNDEPQAQDPTFPSDGTPELPMPRGSEHYAPWSYQLLRAARAGRTSSKTATGQASDARTAKADSDKENAGIRPSSDDKDTEEGLGPRGTKRGAAQGFAAMRWAQLPRNQEEPERDHLAKRRKGLPPVHAIPDISNTAHMRKTKVKRTDAEGQSTVFEVMIPEGQTVEGEIKEEVTLENAGAAIAAPKPGTIVEGLGVANEQGIVVAVEAIAPLRRKGPVAWRKKGRKKGAGKWQQKLSDMTTGGVSASAEALEERKRLEREAGVKADPDVEHDAERIAGDEEDGDSDEDGEEEDEGDDDREDGELSPEIAAGTAAETSVSHPLDGGTESHPPFERSDAPSAPSLTDSMKMQTMTNTSTIDSTVSEVTVPDMSSGLPSAQEEVTAPPTEVAGQDEVSALDASDGDQIQQHALVDDQNRSIDKEMTGVNNHGAEPADVETEIDIAMSGTTSHNLGAAVEPAYTQIAEGTPPLLGDGVPDLPTSTLTRPEDSSLRSGEVAEDIQDVSEAAEEMQAAQIGEEFLPDPAADAPAVEAALTEVPISIETSMPDPGVEDVDNIDRDEPDTGVAQVGEVPQLPQPTADSPSSSPERPETEALTPEPEEPHLPSNVDVAPVEEQEATPVASVQEQALNADQQ